MNTLRGGGAAEAWMRVCKGRRRRMPGGRRGALGPRLQVRQQQLSLAPALLQVLDGKRLAATNAQRQGRVVGWAGGRHAQAAGAATAHSATGLQAGGGPASADQGSHATGRGAQGPQSATTAAPPARAGRRQRPIAPHPLMVPGDRTRVSPFRSWNSMAAEFRRSATTPALPGVWDASRSHGSGRRDCWAARGPVLGHAAGPPPPAVHSAARGVVKAFSGTTAALIELQQTSCTRAIELLSDVHDLQSAAAPPAGCSSAMPPLPAETVGAPATCAAA